MWHAHKLPTAACERGPHAHKMAPQGSGWMHGLVKSISSGDSVLVIGSTTQVRAPRSRARNAQAHFFFLCHFFSRASFGERHRLLAWTGVTQRARSKRDRLTLPLAHDTGWTSTGEDDHARLAHGASPGARHPHQNSITQNTRSPSPFTSDEPRHTTLRISESQARAPVCAWGQGAGGGSGGRLVVRAGWRGTGGDCPETALTSVFVLRQLPLRSTIWGELLMT